MVALTLPLIAHAQGPRLYQIIVIDDVISIEETDQTGVEERASWISLPHCSPVQFKGKFEGNPKIRRDVSISEDWKHDLGISFHAC